MSAVREQEPELFEVERQLADSAGSFVGRSIEDKVLTRASGVWDTMLIKLDDQSKSVVGRLAQGVERDLNRSLQVTLSENLDLVNHQLDSVFATAHTNVGPLVDDAMSSLELGIQDRLRPVLIRVIGEAADSMSSRILALDRKLAHSETGKQVSTVLIVLASILGVTVIGGGLVWHRSAARTREAFQVALSTAAPIQREAAKAQLRDKGYGRQADWLR